MNEGELCPVCWKGKLYKEVITETFQYLEFSCSVDNYIVFVCPQCKENFIEHETLKRIEKIIREFHRDVNNRLKPVGHICFNTKDERGWCIRSYPKVLCSLCFNRRDGIDLNKEQFDKFDKKPSKSGIIDIVLDVENGKEIWINTSLGFQRIKKIIIKESPIHEINHYGTMMFVENTLNKEDGKIVTEMLVIPQP